MEEKKKYTSLEKNINYLVENPQKLDSNFIDSIKDDKYLGSIVAKTVKIPLIKIRNRTFEILKGLHSNDLEGATFRRRCFEGIPDELPMLRSLIWKLMLDLLPSDINQWDVVLEEKRSKYNKLKENILVKFEFEKKQHGNEFIESKKNRVDLNNNNELNDSRGSLSKMKKEVDHPLNTNSNSVWKSYFEDLELNELIEKDVRRTRTQMHFFFMPANTDKLSTLSNEDISKCVDKKRNNPYSQHNNIKYETNADVLCRILFIFAKLYPEIKYIQGMNELLATIYYCFSLDKNPLFTSNIEADTFMCFDSLMCKIKDIFIRKKDSTDYGINGRLKKVFLKLKTIDKELYDHLVAEKIEIQYFAFRWYTLFLTQEFELPDVFRLWDSILSTEDVFDLMNFLCLAIIEIKREDIIKKDFSGMMLSLQNLEKISVDNLIDTAMEIRTAYYSKKENIV